MAEPEVVRTMREFHDALVAADAAQQTEMARRWLQVEKRLESQIGALALEIERMYDRGETINPGKLYRMDRYQKLLSEAQEQTALYSRYADGLITQRQTEMILLGVDHAQGALALGQAYNAFTKLPTEAVENMIAVIAGKAADGGPLGKLLLERMVKQPGAWERLTTTLISASAQGWNPRKTARALRDDLAQGLDKALVIARSEQMRAYTTATLEQQKVAGVMYYKRLSARDDRVCGGCLAADGDEYATKDGFARHPQCRCMSIPIVPGVKKPEWQPAEEWLKQQPGSTQNAILGPGVRDAWQSNTVPFKKLQKTLTNDTWGDRIVPATLRDLTG